MAHMQPEYIRCTFITGEDKDGIGFAYPEGMYHQEDGDVNVERILFRWWARLTAPGYLDCTDWHGPYDTHAAACEGLSELYGINPDTGEDL